MPANSVMSLACNSEGHVFIGTSEGLVEFDPNGTEGLNGNADEGENELDEGSMMRWRLHLSYTNPEEMVSTPRQVVAVANGSLFSVDRADESITYWNKSTGLNGSTVSHIAYDAANGVLLIAYADGRMDLLDDEGNVTQMPDLFMKAGSVSGKYVPISPSPAAPSKASLMACNNTSASLWPSRPFSYGMSTPPIIHLRPSTNL